jgi:transposase
VFRAKDVEEVNELKRQGLSIWAISRLTGYDRRTVTKYLLKPAVRPVYRRSPVAAGKLEPFKPWGFTITVGYSRRMMAAAATDQKLGTLLRMHEAAFREWGAVPQEILFDRMRTVWTGTDEH